MKTPNSNHNAERFQRGIRAHHRHTSGPRPTWDEWVNPGSVTKPRDIKKRIRISGLVLGLLIFGGILAAVLNEMR